MRSVKPTLLGLMILVITPLCTGCGQGSAPPAADNGRPDPNGTPVPVGKKSTAGWEDPTQEASAGDKSQ